MAIDTGALKARVDIVAVARQYFPVAQRGTQYLARCINPAHDDKNPSMWINPQKRMIFCNACGLSIDVIALVMMQEGATFIDAVAKLDSSAINSRFPLTQEGNKKTLERVVSKPPKGSRPPLAHPEFGEPFETYDLLDANGDLLAVEARYRNKARDNKKEVRMWTWGSRGGMPSQWALGHWPTPRPLYGLNRLAQRKRPKVLITEGPKKAEAAQILIPSMVAIAWTGGARGIYGHDWRPVAGRSVVIWPDNDAPGIEGAENLARLLCDPNGNVGCTDVDIIYPTDAPPKWDLADALKDNWDTDKVLDWGIARRKRFVPEWAGSPESADAATPRASIPIPELSTDVGSSPDEPSPPPEIPPSEFPPEATANRPREPVRLVARYGNAVPEPEIDDDDNDAPDAKQLTEISVASYFASIFRNKHKVCHDWRSKHGALWLSWTGTRWRKQPTRVAAWADGKALAARIPFWRSASELTKAKREAFATRKFVESILHMAQFDQRLIMEAKEFDADPLLLGTPSGTVDLRTGQMREPRPEDFITRQTTVAPEQADHPLWDSVIERASGGEEDMARYLWRWIGYSITGCTNEEAFLFLYGKPQSGKTTLIEAIAEILGDIDDGGYATKVDMDMFLVNKYDTGTDRLAHLYGARFAHCAETEEGRTWKESLLSEATGGDTLVGKFLYHDRFSFRPSHSLWVHGNHRPHLKNISGGLRRRLHLLEYPGVISEDERDLDFKSKLRAEYPAILHSMILAAREWLEAGGLGMPERISDNVKTYLQQEDTLGAFLEACCDTSDPQATAPSSAAYERYKTFLTQMGEFIPSQKSFSQRLIDRGFRVSPGRVRFVQGLRLLEAPGEASKPYLD